jgi:hypothetical protein
LRERSRAPISPTGFCTEQSPSFSGRAADGIRAGHQPQKFAITLGLPIPPNLLALADEVSNNCEISGGANVVPWH